MKNGIVTINLILLFSVRFASSVLIFSFFEFFQCDHEKIDETRSPRFPNYFWKKSTDCRKKNNDQLSEEKLCEDKFVFNLRGKEICNLLVVGVFPQKKNSGRVGEGKHPDATGSLYCASP